MTIDYGALENTLEQDNPLVGSDSKSSSVNSPRVRRNPIDVIVYFLIAAFSLWLMFHTFGYDTRAQTMLITDKVWSDFASHIPLIRSFSLGSNWPPEYPLYSGEPIRYHFLFYYFVGLLERVGLRIDVALNAMSAIGFFLMLLLTYKIGLLISSSRRVACGGVLFLVFNGSLSFFRYFNEKGLSIKSVIDIFFRQYFVSFGPWDGGDIAAFWSLTIFTNQRHLAWGFALTLALLYAALRQEDRKHTPPYGLAMVFGLLIALLPYFHQPTLILVATEMVVGFIFLPRARFFLFLVGVQSFLPLVYQVFSLLGTESGRSLTWNPGYLAIRPHTFWSIATYWFHNVGLHLLVAPIGALFLGRRAIVPLLVTLILFVIGNLIQFSVEMAANHKFFNFTIIIAGIFSAGFAVRLWDAGARFGRRSVLVGGLLQQLSLATICFLTLSGVIEIMPIINDFSRPLPDRVPGSAAEWIDKNTSRSSTFLNSGYIFHPASISGRKIFQGWPYFTWGNGYPGRDGKMREFYGLRSKREMCVFLTKHRLDYFSVEKTEGNPNLPEIDVEFYAQNVVPVFKSNEPMFYIFHLSSVCESEGGSQGIK
jgi:hypothetical protein